MKQERVPTALAALLAGMLGLSAAACAAAPVASSDAERRIDDGLRIEEAVSSRFEFNRVRVRRSEDALSVSGDVSRVISSRGFIPGQVEVRLLGPDGRVLAEDRAKPTRRNRQARSAHFFVRLPVQAPAGSTVEIVHRRG
jgi:hypothetical protein